LHESRRSAHALRVMLDPALGVLGGLASHARVDGKLAISAPPLSSFAELHSLERVGGDLTLGQSSATTLADLGALQSVGGTFAVASEPNLTHVNVLPNLASVGALDIENDPTLRTCDAQGLLAALRAKGLPGPRRSRTTAPARASNAFALSLVGRERMRRIASETELTRRAVLSLATASTVAAGVASAARAVATPASVAAPGSTPPALERFIADYMRVMNAPGMTLGLASREGTVATAAYGLADLEARAPVTTSHLFEIGSITKSFVGLVVLGLQEEGKLDVEHPILRYLPSLPVDASFGEIQIHHLLTHTSGMPDDTPVWPSDPTRRAKQSLPPGWVFHYCNWGYQVLGHLIEKIEGVAWLTSVRRRILAPLGMNDTGPIANATRSRLVRSYVPFFDDRPYPKDGPLAPARGITYLPADGGIASTALDMTRYMQMLLNRGAGPRGRVVSPAAFERFMTKYVKAPEFGPNASYGYGIGIDDVDGHMRLRHTGGMGSFMSAMQLDLDAGFGAFASINAMQGYRPNPVVQYAIQLMRRSAEGAPAPAPPAADAAFAVAHPEDYVGTYTSPAGRRFQIVVDAGRLVLVDGPTHIPLQALLEGDQFVAIHPRYETFPLVFGRDPPSSEAEPGVAARPLVIDLGHGADWYAHARFKGDRREAPAPSLSPFVGTYSDGRNVTRVVIRRGQLWLDGATKLVTIGDGVFRIGDKASSPGATLEFRRIVDGRAQLLFAGDGAQERADVPDWGT
jgi:D-alanyl-D-alanine carboxypeptidase